eukprot:18879-Pelagococcus_subviridis.AAC.4
MTPSRTLESITLSVLLAPRSHGGPLRERLRPRLEVVIVRLAQTLRRRVPPLGRARVPVRIAVPVRGGGAKRRRPRPHDQVHPLPRGDDVRAVPLPAQVHHRAARDV